MVAWGIRKEEIKSLPVGRMPLAILGILFIAYRQIPELCGAAWAQPHLWGGDVLPPWVSHGAASVVGLPP